MSPIQQFKTTKLHKYQYVPNPHPLTPSHTQLHSDEPHKTIFDDARRLPNIAKEIAKEITKERMKPSVADPHPPTAQLVPLDPTPPPHIISHPVALQISHIKPFLMMPGDCQTLPKRLPKRSPKRE